MEVAFSTTIPGNPRLQTDQNSLYEFWNRNSQALVELHPKEIATKSAKHFGHIKVDNKPRSKTEMASTSNTAKDRSKELANHGQPSSYEGKDLSSKLTQNTLIVTVANCSMILVGQSNKEQVRRNHCCDQRRLQCEVIQKNPTLMIVVSNKREWQKKSNVNNRFSTKARLDQTAVQREQITSSTRQQKDW